ncbi:MAG: hypothetical protein PHV76_05610 [Bacteroidales bacterium]|nr:hypothetical protein [Bacteroidales bacterium]
MLQASFHHKIKFSSNFTKLIYTEDVLTSSFFGLLQYLPSKLIIDILSDSINLKLKHEEIGELKEILFWPKYNSKGTSNKNFVEPDIFMEFEYADMLFEIKHKDGFGQYTNQWENEIISYYNEYSENNKSIYFFAIGGNTNLISESLLIDGRKHIINKTSWHLLLNKVVNTKKSIINNIIKIDNEKGVIRIIDDIITSFEKHNYYQINWFENIDLKYSINNNAEKIINKWKIGDKSFLFKIAENREKINNDTLNIISKWKI